MLSWKQRALAIGKKIVKRDVAAAEQGTGGAVSEGWLKPNHTLRVPSGACTKKFM